MLNKIILIGRLGADTNPQTAKNGKEYTRLSIATNSGFYDANKQWQERTDWHTVIAWWRVNALKGETIFVEGELTYHSTEDTKTAQISAKSIKVISYKGNVEKVSKNEEIKLSEDLPF